jgi:hypothetical protein
VSTTAAVASIIAALTGIVALTVAVRETRRWRLVEIIDLVTDIKAAILWGSQSSLRRDELQGRLRTRLARMKLPKTRELASAQLRSEQPYAELADEALVELRDALDTGSFSLIHRSK